MKTRPPTLLIHNGVQIKDGDRWVDSPDHMRGMEDQAIVANIGHFDNEIQVEKLNAAKDVTRLNIKPQMDKHTYGDGHSIYLLSEGRRVNLGNATGRPSFVMNNSFTNQTLAQLDLWANLDSYEPGVRVLDKKLDEEVAWLHGAGAVQ